MLRQMAIRFFLHSSPSERHVLGALLHTISLKVSAPAISPPIDGIDAEGLAIALAQQLSLRQSNETSINMRYTTVITEYTLTAIERSGLFHLYAPMLVAAFDRVWYEMDRSCQKPSGECWQNILLFANLLVYALGYVL